MLEERSIDWTREWREKGFQEGKKEGYEVGRKEGWDVGRAEGRREGRREGREEGRKEGRKEGEAEVLLRLLERKFGPVGDEYREKIEQADDEQLLQWAERVLSADRIEDVIC